MYNYAGKELFYYYNFYCFHAAVALILIKEHNNPQRKATKYTIK